MSAPRGRPPVRVRRIRTEERWSWLDLRLVPPAATVWIATLAGRFLPGVLLLALAVLGAAAAAALLVRSRRRSGAAGVVAVGCLAALTVACAISAAHVQARAASPLPQLAAAAAVLPVVVRLEDDPRPLAGAGEPRVLVRGTVSEVADRRVDGGAVLLFGPAEQWSRLSPGQSVRVRAAVRPAQPGDEVLAVLSARSPPTLVHTVGPVQAAAGVLRAGLASSATRILPPRPAGLLPGLVVGDTSALDPGLAADFRRSGLSHLTAVSGANVAIVVALVLWPLRARGAGRRLQATVAAMAIIGFVVLARPGASVLRAAVMGGVALLALASGRSRAAVPALSAAVVVLLLAEPALATDAGFALSVAATAAIVLLAPTWSRRLRRNGIPRPLADALAVSAAAGLVTAPLVAALSGVVSLVSLPANLLAAPAVAPATVLGLLASLVSPLAPGTADALTWLAGWPVRWLVAVAERAAAVPDGATAWPAGARGAVLLALLLAGGGWALVCWPRLRPLTLAALVGVVVLGWPVRQVSRGWPLPDTVLVACDVGQGDALVLPTAPGEAVLVDAGPEGSPVAGCLDRLGVRRLPLVLLSHLDADHAGGLAAALAGREVGEVATGTLAPTDDRVPHLQEVVDRAGGHRTVLVPGERRTSGGAVFDVLAPAAGWATATAEPNDLSMVMRVTVRGVRVLFTGDLGAEAEARILRQGTDLSADVLKVPHHGSADADPAFLAASHAVVALVSVGADNSYGHPASRLLDQLSADGMRTYRTDRDGDVAVVGRAGRWGVAVRGPDVVQRATASGARIGPAIFPAGTPPAPAAWPPAPAVARSRRARVAAWPRGIHRPGSSASGPDVPAARGGRGGGAVARPRGLGGARRGARAPPGERGTRAGGGRSADR